MKYFEIILPLRFASGAAVPEVVFSKVKDTLNEKFGGVTAFTQSPAEGLWKSSDGGTERDVVIVLEVIAESLDRQWWADFKRHLAKLFDQKEILIRLSDCELI